MKCNVSNITKRDSINIKAIATLIISVILSIILEKIKVYIINKVIVFRNAPNRG